MFEDNRVKVADKWRLNVSIILRASLTVQIVSISVQIQFILRWHRLFWAGNATNNTDSLGISGNYQCVSLQNVFETEGYPEDISTFT